jgi:hypothetical protein
MSHGKVQIKKLEWRAYIHVRIPCQQTITDRTHAMP